MKIRGGYNHKGHAPKRIGSLNNTFLLPMDIKYLYNPNNTNIDNIEISLHTDLNRTTFSLTV